MPEKDFREIPIGEHIKSLTEIDEDKLIDFQVINILQCQDPEKLPFLVAILEKMMIDELDDGYVKELQEAERSIKVSDPKFKNVLMGIEKFGLLYRRRKRKIPSEVIATLGLEKEKEPEEVETEEIS